MSPLRLSISRKRPFCSDSSDSDSDEDFPIKKCNTGVVSRMRQLLLWITDLSAKPYFTSYMKMGSSIPIHNIEEDDDDDDEVTIIDEVPSIKGKPNPFYNKVHNRHAFVTRTRRKPTYEIPESFAYSGLRGLTLEESDVSENGVYRRRHENLDSCYLFDRSLNGSASNDLHRRIHSQHVTSSHKNSVLPKVLAPVTNPETDVAMLIDTFEKTSSDADDVVLLSDVSTPRQSASRVRKGSNAKLVIPVDDSSIFTRHEASSKRNYFTEGKMQSASFKPYTANEVIRLQEKTLYQQLLDKYQKNQIYYPIKKTEVPVAQLGSSNDSAVFKDLSKEILRQPVDSYIEKFFKPLQLVSSQQSSDKVDQKSEEKDDSEDSVIEIDDDVSILKVCIPKYKPHFSVKPDFFDPVWLAQLQSELHAETEERKKIEESQLKRLERLKKERLEQLIIQAIEPQKEREKKLIETPKITPDMNAIIESALSRPSQATVTNCSSGSLTQKDIETLVGFNWLNDEVINYYLNLIVDRNSSSENLPKVYAFNTFFYSTLKQRGYNAVRRWTRKVDVFSYDKLLVPLHLEVHWALAVISPKKNKIEYYDSMGSGEMSCFAVLSDYIAKEMKDKKGKECSSEFVTEKMNAPVQMNGSDCGMFTLKYSEYISRNAPMNFDQENIPYFRRRMIYELLTNTLL